MLLLWATLALAGDDPFGLEPQTAVLANGLTVIVERIDRTDTVALHLTYGVGSRDEQQGELGCAHLFEHLMFEGSANVPTGAFDEWLTAAGGSNNAWTSGDETAYHMTFPSGALELALMIESDRMGFLSAGLTQENLSNQSDVVLQERAEGYAEPHGRDWDAMTRLTFPAGHPYHHPVIGTVADVEGFELEGVVDFWKRHYRPRNATLAIVGNVDPDEAMERIALWFSDIPDPGPALDRAPVTPALQGAFRHGLVEDDVEERTVYLLWPTVELGHADEPALELLSYALSYGRDTRIDDLLYYKSNKATDAGAFHYPQDIAGQMIAYASSPTTPLKKLDKGLRKAVASILKDPPDAADLDRARRASKGSLLDSLEDNTERANWLVDCHRRTGDADCLAAEWKRYEAVTPADLQRVAETYLTEDRISTLSIVPRGDDGALAGAVTVELP